MQPEAAIYVDAFEGTYIESGACIGIAKGNWFLMYIMYLCTFKCPLKKTQPSCPVSRDLNWTGKGLNQWRFKSSGMWYSVTGQVVPDMLKAYSDCMGLGSSVGIAAGYGLDGLGIEPQWGRDFSHVSRPALGPTQPPVQWYRVFPGGKAAEVWCWPPTPF
jgi:hypothetical protein